MNFQTSASSNLQTAMAACTHPDYEGLPESVKMNHSPAGYAWLGDEEKARAVERETQPDYDVIE